jgi:hypothetical protein
LLLAWILITVAAAAWQCPLFVACALHAAAAAAFRAFAHGASVGGTERRGVRICLIAQETLVCRSDGFACENGVPVSFLDETMYGVVWYGMVPLLPHGPQSLRPGGGSWIGRQLRMLRLSPFRPRLILMCLLAQGFTQCESAPCLCIRPHADGIVIVGLFVDDMLLINYSTDPNSLDNLINKELSPTSRSSAVQAWTSS